MLRWSDATLGGLAHIPWKPFDHPQLGKVEIGGWNRFHAFSNPPPQLLEREIAALSEVARVAGADLAEARAGACGRRRRSAAATTRSCSSCRTRAGCRRTSASARSSARSCAASIAEIELPAGAALVEGKRREEHGQLEGRAYKHTGISFWPDYHVTDDRMKIEWVVRGKTGDVVKLVARHERAGTVRATVTLP